MFIWLWAILYFQLFVSSLPPLTCNSGTSVIFFTLEFVSLCYLCYYFSFLANKLLYKCSGLYHFTAESSTFCLDDKHREIHVHVVIWVKCGTHPNPIGYTVNGPLQPLAPNPYVILCDAILYLSNSSCIATLSNCAVGCCCHPQILLRCLCMSLVFEYSIFASQHHSQRDNEEKKREQFLSMISTFIYYLFCKARVVCYPGPLYGWAVCLVLLVSFYFYNTFYNTFQFCMVYIMFSNRISVYFVVIYLVWGCVEVRIPTSVDLHNNMFNYEWSVVCCHLLTWYLTATCCG